MSAWKPERQADQIIRRWDRVGHPRIGALPGDTRDRHLYSIRTREEYRAILVRQATWARKTHGRTLDRLTPDQTREYLEGRAKEVGDKRLSQERCALALLDHLRPYEQEWKREIQSAKKGPGRLATVSRSLKGNEAARVMEYQTDRNVFATEVALAGSLRASELMTLRPIAERPPSPRQEWDERRFNYLRDPVAYTVQGKGGLVREVRFERELADRIEARRWEDGKLHRVKDRGVPCLTRYNLVTSSNAWEQSFRRACKQALGHSLGAHSTRHTFVAERMDALKAEGFGDYEARLLVSQQLGHFRPEILDDYLR